MVDRSAFHSGLLTARGLRFGTIRDVGIAVNMSPIPHLAILKDWGNIVLRKFTNDTMAIAPYSYKLRTEYWPYYDDCDVSASCRCFPELKASTSVIDIERHWRTRPITAWQRLPPFPGPERSEYQKLTDWADEKQVITEKSKINSMQDDDERLRDGYPTGRTVTESYLRTLLSNKIGNANPLTSEWMSVFTLSEVLCVNKSWSTPVPYDFERLRQVVWNDELHAALGSSIRNRRLIVLSNKYMGLAPAHTQVGHVVCVLSGAIYIHQS